MKESSTSEAPPVEAAEPVEEEQELQSDLLEDGEAIEFTVKGKKPLTILMGDPGVSIFDIMRRVFSGSKEPPGNEAMAFMYVRKVNDVDIPPLKTLHDLRTVRKLLGNRGSMIVAAKWAKHFMIDADSVEVVKKNLP